jgi:hypothetical protein
MTASRRDPRPHDRATRSACALCVVVSSGLAAVWDVAPAPGCVFAAEDQAAFDDAGAAGGDGHARHVPPALGAQIGVAHAPGAIACGSIVRGPSDPPRPNTVLSRAPKSGPPARALP